jgi:hypothetical protein
MYDYCGPVHRVKGEREDDPKVVARTTEFISNKILEKRNRKFVVMPWTKVPFVFTALITPRSPTFSHSAQHCVTQIFENCRWWPGMALVPRTTIS